MSDVLHAADWRELGLDAAQPAHRRSLIEASAGTGKTWTISVLYLRLLLEAGHGVRAIVVTTFTDAAAQELRERIRARLRLALALAQRDDGARADIEPELQAWLQRRWSMLPRERDRLLLRLALAELDLAPIGTMHSLCRRILAEAPFAAGSALRAPTLIATEELHEELATDLMRHLAQLTPVDDGERSACTSLLRLSPERRRALVDVLLRSGVEFDAASDDGSHLLDDAAAWVDRIEALADPAWHVRSTGAVANQLRQLAAFLRAGDVHGEYRDNGSLDDDGELQGRVRPERIEAMRSDPAYRRAQAWSRRLASRQRAALSRLLFKLQPLLRAWRDARLQERDQLGFDQLIEQVRAAVSAPDGALADTLHARWPVALIDEFQDTDPAQFAIFDRIHRDADGAARGLLLLIGDPKQAIYGFRGGDLETYLVAARAATQTLRLHHNFRATPPLVEALNTLYGASANAFGDRDGRIRYLPVQAVQRAGSASLSDRDGPSAALSLHIDTAPERERALAACADLIATDLQAGQVRLGLRPLQPGDVAVLLPAHRDVALMRRLLQQRNVPCVGSGRASVFESEWARELRLVLHACLHGGDSAAVRAALSTQLLGFDFAALQALADDSGAWQAQADRFLALAHDWQQQGVLRVVELLLEGAAPRLLALVDGERACTDLRHLGELLQAQGEQLGGREQLLAWFAQQCDRALAADEDAARERLLRIESDQTRVQLLTLHASKGLEFAIVHLPLMWAHRGRDDAFPMHRRDGRRCVDLGSEWHEQARAAAAEEQRRERLRVLYVALTRASQRCHVFSGPWPEATAVAAAHTPALDVLLAGCDRSALATCAQIALREGWPKSAAALPRPSGDTSARHARVARAAHRLLAAHSFSSLTRDALLTPRLDPESPAADEVEAEPAAGAAADEPAHPQLLRLASHRGAAFGTAVHGVFEFRRDDAPLSQQHALVEEQLRLAGMRSDETLVASIAARVDACLHAELAPGLRLLDLPAAQRRAEMDFQFVVPHLRGAELHSLCARYGEPELVPSALAGRDIAGSMSGKIDLLFEFDGRVHLLDYKSNYLGDRLSAYRGDALEQAMQHGCYPLQAFLYTLALDRYLQGRLRDYRREQHLGDCWYLFVRAVALDAGAGIWRRRFAPALVDAAQALFAGAAEGAQR